MAAPPSDDKGDNDNCEAKKEACDPEIDALLRAALFDVTDIEFLRGVSQNGFLKEQDLCGRTPLHLCTESPFAGPLGAGGAADFSSASRARGDLLQRWLAQCVGTSGDSRRYSCDGTCIDTKDSLGETPLALAVRSAAFAQATLERRRWSVDGSSTCEREVGIKAVRFLLEARACPDCCDPAVCETPLMEAASVGDLAACRLLLVFKAEPGLLSATGRSAAELAGEYPDIVGLLERWSGSARNDAVADEILEASAAQDVGLLRAALLAVAGPPAELLRRCRAKDGSRSVLHLAAGSSTPLAPSEQPAEGVTAALRGGGSVEVVRLLLTFQAEVDLRGPLGETPLAIACRAAAGVEALPGEHLHTSASSALEACSDSGLGGCNSNDVGGDEPAPWPLEVRLAVVQALLDARADANAADEIAGETPLMEAACAGDKALCQLLLAAGADTRQPNCCGFLASDFAANADVMSLLEHSPGVASSVCENRPAEVSGVPRDKMQPEEAPRPSPSGTAAAAAPRVAAAATPSRSSGSTAARSMGKRPRRTPRCTADRPRRRRPAAAPPKPSRPPKPSPLEELQGKCAGAGLAVDWCFDANIMLPMLLQAKRWEKAEISDLLHECAVKRIPVKGHTSNRGELCARLGQVLSWENEPMMHLRITCMKQDIPLPGSGQQFGSAVYYPTGRERPEDRADIVLRLTRHSYGPLPDTMAAEATTPPNAPPKRKPFPQPPAQPEGSKTSAMPPPRASAKPPPRKQPSPPPRKQPSPPARKQPSPPPRKQPSPPPSRQPPKAPQGPPKAQPVPKRASLPPGGNGSSDDRTASSELLMQMREHYATLGLAPGAGLDAVRKTYRRLALRFHPDKNPESNDDSTFKQITAAYEALCQLLV